MIPAGFHLTGSTQEYILISFKHFVYTTITFYDPAFQQSSTILKICDLSYDFLESKRIYPTTLYEPHRQNG